MITESQRQRNLEHVADILRILESESTPAALAAAEALLATNPAEPQGELNLGE